ncbi:hypothetical protein PRIPAC_89880 [Pristionchus pacificus]|uniref:Uncharacterized protein n=1 Tax=Pristionchus pacificus TaxID=54126 RepID=A0A2A6B9T0_PRIPA|nr:hypothetical protein PRIPAC_89880 [Pristionchus pacificus]|eukprot:PDM62623.1 hypothetical protein PRIPAC_52065 [Pristionchus pacificus]
MKAIVKPANSCHIGPNPGGMLAGFSAYAKTGISFGYDTFANPDPAYLECSSNACRCKGTALMPFDNIDGSTRYFPFMGMNEEGKWVGFSAYARGTDKKNDGRAHCVNYTPATYQLCGDLYTYEGMQKGDLPCGENQFSHWTEGGRKYTSVLTCAPEGWMADGFVVRPEFVHCIKDS